MNDPKRVLIVDDDEGVAFTIESYLEMEFDDAVECATFTTPSCGKASLEWLKTNRPDWAVLDLILNGVNGFKIVNSILEKYKGVPILIISGCAKGSDEIVEATKLAMNRDFNIKFATKMHLADTISKECGVIRDA